MSKWTCHSEIELNFKPFQRTSLSVYVATGQVSFLVTKSLTGQRLRKSYIPIQKSDDSPPPHLAQNSKPRLQWLTFATPLYT